MVISSSKGTKAHETAFLAFNQSGNPTSFF
jgi:hypothetical protein